MVDAVVTWVDGSDPAHVAKRKYWLAQLQGSEAISRHGTLHTRWESSFELYYCIHLIRRNAPWIEKIYLVTDEQRPDWLTEEEARRLDVVLVDHKTIFAGFEGCLPTFNSDAIEAVLHRVPGLSDRYLYFNDDVFLLRPTPAKKYFHGERAYWRGRFEKRFTVKQLLKFGRWIAGARERDGFVGVRKERAVLELKRVFNNAHAPYPFFRDLTRDVIEESGWMEENMSQKFRKWESVSVPQLVSNAAILRGYATKGPGDWEYIHSEHSEEEVDRRLERCLKEKKIKSLCVQSLDMMSKQMQDKIERLLGQALQGI